MVKSIPESLKPYHAGRRSIACSPMSPFVAPVMEWFFPFSRSAWSDGDRVTCTRASASAQGFAIEKWSHA